VRRLPDTLTRRTARHGACRARQGARRHPCRQSRPLQAEGQAPRRAGPANPWPSLLGLGGYVPDARHPWLAIVQLQLSLKLEAVLRQPTASPSQAGRDMKDHRMGLTVAWLITPHPPHGGSGRPSNITRDYAHISYVSGGGRAVLARRDPRPRNQRYVKWPRRLRSKRCAAHYRAWCLRPLIKAQPQAPLEPHPPHPPCVGLRAAAAASRPSLPPAARRTLLPATTVGEKRACLACRSLAPCSPRQGQATCCAPLTDLRAALPGNPARQSRRVVT